MASQIGGKTEMINNCMFYHMHWKPSQCIIMYPTIDSAEKYSKKKFTPSALATPEIERILAPARARDSGNTILVKEFVGGSIFFVGSNSTASLRQASGPVLIADEIDDPKCRENQDGDPVELLWKRGESFSKVTQIVSSTPTIKGASPIWNWFESSDQRYWFVPCVHCSEYITFTWSMMQWPKGEPSKAVLICPKCAMEINDAQRREMYFAGEWRATAPFKGIRGFHLSGLYSPWKSKSSYANMLHQFAEDCTRSARKGSSAVRVWVNTFLCQTYEIESEKVEASSIAKRSENYGPEIPDGVMVIVAGIDTQGDRICIDIVGVGAGEETWGIKYQEIYGNPLLPAVWAELDKALDVKFRKADGTELRIVAAGVDTGGVPGVSGIVMDYCKARSARRIFAMKGSSRPADPIAAGPRRNNRRKCHLWIIGTDTAKSLLMSRLKQTEAGPGYMHFPLGKEYGYDENYFSMLTAEEVRQEFKRGRATRVWVKVRPRNEALDCRVYALGALTVLQPDFRAIEKRVNRIKPVTDPGKTAESEPEETSQEAQPEPVPKKKRKQLRLPRRGGWVWGWK